MAVKWLQSAVYPRAEPQFRVGRTPEENDADYARLQAATRWAREETYAADQKGQKGTQRNAGRVRQ